MMLEFAVTPEDQIVIDNTNLLIHEWEPLSQNKSRVLSDEGMLTVDAHERLDFQNDLMALNIYYEDFNALLKKRAAALKVPFVPNLQTYYTLGQRYQGLLALAAKVHSIIFDKCYDLLVHIGNLSEKLSQVECEVIQSITKLLVDEHRKTNHLLLEITASKQFLLTEILHVYGYVTLDTGEIQQVFEGHNLIMRRILMGEFKIGQTMIQIKAQLQAQFSTTIPSTLPTFSSLVNFHFHQNNTMIPILMSMYPRISTLDHATPITLQQFSLCSDDAVATVNAQVAAHQCGRLHYSSPQLAVALSGPLAEDIYADKLPWYFQAMVEIAKNHHCHQIVLYTPNDFADIAFAFGFHPREHEKITTSQQNVKTHLTNKTRVPRLPASVNVYANQVALMQPLYFPLGELDSRKVYFTEKDEVTTYAKLIEKLTLFKQTTSNSILPDPYKLMARPFSPTFQALRKREITGKNFRSDVAGYVNGRLDANSLKENKELAALGEGAHIQSTEPKSIFRILN